MSNFIEAEEHYRKSLQISPNNPETHWNLDLTLLSLGDFTRGWNEYEWRWRWDAFTSPRLEFDKRVWSGETGSVLLHTEQGLGDSLQFIRYASMARLLCQGEVFLLAEPSLVPILETVEGIDCVLLKGTPGDDLPEFDYQIPLMSLPAIWNKGEFPSGSLRI